MNILEAAFFYRDSLGWSPIPVNRPTKTPRLEAGFLQTYSKRLPRDEELEAWFANIGDDTAIGVITPEDVLAIDIDDRSLWPLFFHKSPESKARETIVHATPRGFRVFVRVPPGSLTSKIEARFPGGHRGVELKPGGKGYSLVPPSQGYESLSSQPLLQSLRAEEVETLVGCVKLFARTARLIDSLKDGWIEGCRHGLAGSLAGWLRKKGFSKNQVGEIVEAICRLAGDNEVGDRLRFVDDSFIKPVGEVAGISVLRNCLRDTLGKDKAEEIISMFTVDLEEEKEFNVKAVADAIMSSHIIITSEDRNEDIYVFRNGVYTPGEAAVSSEINRILDEDYSRYRCQEVLDFIRKRTYVRLEEFEPPPSLILLENGVLNLETLELRPSSPGFFFFNKLPVAYDPDASCPSVEKFLGEIVDPEDRPVLEEMAGYCLYRSYPIQKAVMLVGPGSNGRSTFLNLLTSLLGQPNVAARTWQELETDRFAVADLYHKLANIHADLPPKVTFSTASLKTLTGGDLVKAERKYGHSFTFKNYAKLVFSANQVPDVYDESDAFFRRMVIVNFPNQFLGDKADKGLLAKLATPGELSGFLNIALKGLKRLLQQGDFTNAKTIGETREEYKRKASPVFAFLQDCCEADADGCVEKDFLYDRFAKYCRELKTPVLSRESFFKRLPAEIPVSYDRARDGDRRIRIVRGIRLLEPPALAVRRQLVYKQVGINGERRLEGF